MNFHRQSCALDSGSKAAPSRGLPGSIRLLAMISTVQWRPQSRISPAIETLALQMTARGWTIRGAYPRNYLLWRHGRILTATTCRIVVLPIVFGRLSDAEINVFLATELFMARQRAEAGNAVLTNSQFEELEHFCQRMAVETGLALLNREHVYRKAEKEIERT